MADIMKELTDALGLDARFDEGKIAGVRAVEVEFDPEQGNPEALYLDWPSDDCLAQADWEADLESLRLYA